MNIRLLAASLLLSGLALAAWFTADEPTRVAVASEPPVPDRSPIDLILTPDERLLITANFTAGTISLVRVEDGSILSEVPCGERPAAVVLTPDAKHVLVSASYSGDVVKFALEDDTLKPAGKAHVRFEPRGLAVSPDGTLAYVGLAGGSAVAVLDVATMKEVDRIETGKWPRTLALSPDGSRLAVGVSGSGGVAVIDTETRKQLFVEDFIGLNLGQMEVSKDGLHAYVPWMIYRNNPITPNNIKIGWVLASRIARVRLDRKARREAISLDPRGEAVSDPHGLALSPDEQWMVCSSSGTHELLVFKLPGLPFQDYGGPGDHIDADLLADKDRFYRIALGGRPMALRYSQDSRHVYVANYLLNEVQVVDVRERKIVRTIFLGGPEEPSLERKGEAVFYDAQHSLDQWYSCHSCHYEGHTNAVAFDTRNDGRFGNFKTALSLRHVTETAPWTWHGWQNSLEDAVRKSITETMLGKRPPEGDVQAGMAFLKTIKPPPNPYREPDGALSDQAKRGEQVFRSEKAACVRCHPGPYFTRDRNYDVRTRVRGDAYPDYNPPSLIAVYDRVKLLHDGSVSSLEELLTGPHDPDRFIGEGKLTDEELEDLIAYLKSL